ncbi:MAG: ribosomal-processing cysteine protease Prp [Spirochaetia bacterium]|nr:ribosomal-processing cysteine protease Prp [Spirochaetia bacterium]
MQLVFSEDQLVGLKVEGHANWGPVGSDPLCAAVSVLVQNLDASLELILGLQVERETGKGLHRIQVAREAMESRAELLFASAVLGISALAEQFPDRVRLIR